MSRYVRTQMGRMVHRASCRHVEGRGFEWRWAHGKPIQQLLREVHELGLQYKFCRDCLPAAHAEEVH